MLGKGLDNHPSLHEQDIAYREIPSGRPTFSHPMRALHSMRALYKGYRRAKQELTSFSPDLVIGFGSYHSLPILIAAWGKKIPIFLHEQNLTLGKVNRLFSHVATGIGMAFSAAGPFSCPSQEVTLPKRRHHPPSKEERLEGKSPILCVVGGSQGAKTLNDCVPPALVSLAKEYPNMHVHHIAGPKGDVEAIQRVYSQSPLSFCVTHFEHDMLAVLLSSDLVISRAGATILDELLWARVPSILIPYPGAYGHQEENAKFLTDIGGGGMLLETHLSIDVLRENIFLALDPRTMKNRKEALQNYAQNRSSKSFYQFVCECL